MLSPSEVLGFFDPGGGVRGLVKWRPPPGRPAGVAPPDPRRWSPLSPMLCGSASCPSTCWATAMSAGELTTPWRPTPRRIARSGLPPPRGLLLGLVPNLIGPPTVGGRPRRPRALSALRPARALGDECEAASAFGCRPGVLSPRMPGRGQGGPFPCSRGALPLPPYPAEGP